MADHQPANYNIFGVVAGEDNVFLVNIQPDATVDELKDAIKKEKANAFATIDADELTLFKVDVFDLDNSAEQIATLDLSSRQMNPIFELSKYYPATPPEETIHILVRLPNIQRTGKRKSDDDPLEDDLNTKRRRILETMPDHSPSLANVESMRKAFEDKIDYNRPVPLFETIPIAILHDVFGTFLDDFRGCQPTAPDNACLHGLRSEMLTGSPFEYMHTEMLWGIFQEYGIEMESVPIRSCSTDRHAKVGNHIFCIMQGKNEWSTSSSDPLLQAFLKYIKSIGEIPEKERDARLPCLLIYYRGPFIGFAGAITGEKPQLEPLTPMFTLQVNEHDTAAMQPIARALHAARKAYQSLKEMYEGHEGTTPTTGPMFPHRDYYMDNGNKVTFKYHRRMDRKKLLFECRRTDDQERLCVKFAQRYSREAHEHCASNGMAPKLYAVDTIPGGWLMVVMEFLPDDVYDVYDVYHAVYEGVKYEGIKSKLRQILRSAIDTLHENGLVHGDIRAGNIMVRQEWDSANDVENVKLIDFDWSGSAKSTVYPPYVNHQDIVRPKDARDGLAVKEEHDVFMLERVLSGLDSRFSS